jgi:hypothetical protein
MPKRPNTSCKGADTSKTPFFGLYYFKLQTNLNW